MFLKYFLKKKPIDDEVFEKPREPTSLNWCLFISKNGDSGIFFTNFGPGIKDYKNGILYVVPDKYIQRNCMRPSSAYYVGMTILKYFGKKEKRANGAAWDY